MSHTRNEALERLVSAVLALDTREECHRFFEDICTIKELDEMARRLDVAVQLSAGKNYQEISAATGASTATISRVNKCLLYGGGGYAAVLARLQKEENSK